MAKKFYMSNNQKRLYIINQLQGNDISYNTPKVLIFPGRFDLKRLNESFNELCKRHELLRTTFANNGDKFYQIVQEEVAVKLEVDLDLTKGVQESFKEFLQPFNLTKAPLMRLKVQENEESSLLMFDFHHIICDAISVDIFVNELLSLYKGESLKENKIQYKDFAAWQNSKDMSAHKDFWLKEFSELPPIVDLKTDFNRPKWKSINGKTIHKAPNYELSKLVREFCHKNNTTEFMMLLSAFMAFLSKYNSQDDITVGIPVANRTHPESHNMVGMFVNTLAVNSRIDKSQSFTSLLSVMKDKIYSIFDHQEYPFEELVEKLKVERDVSRNPLFDIMFVFQNSEDKKYILNGNELTEIKDVDYPVSKFDLTLTIDASESGYEFSWEYCNELFKESTIAYIDKLFEEFIKNVIVTPSDNLETINMVNEAEYTLLFDNVTKEPRTKMNGSILDAFNNNVQNITNNPALKMGNLSMSYLELDQLSNKLSTKLIKKGLKPESIVALLFDRSFETIVTILGVLKSGAAFLPIEPNLPKDRINYILENSKASLLISNLEEFNFASLRGEILHYKEIDFSKIPNEESSIPRDEDMLMYVIYTSGSTGKPKGVAIKESSLLNYLEWGQQKYIKTKDDAFGFYSPLSFDLTITSVFLPLVSGLTMHIYSSKDYASALIDLVKDNKVTILKLTPSHMKIVSQLDIENAIFHTLIVGGEELTVQTAKEMTLKVKHPISIINEYGPTEATIGCATHEYNLNNDDMLVPIGRAINNTQLYVLNSDLKHQPYGVVGELYISGECLAYGYFNNPELTNKKFVENPFIPEAKMYATGDLVYKRSDGNLIYCGRMDDQTKLKGFRINLEEIEKILKNELTISGVSVHIKNLNEGDFLCAYLVGNNSSEKDIKDMLGNFLPDYMVPTFIIDVESIPLTSNGKVDKGKLPAPVFQSSESYVAPRNELETVVINIFTNVLGTRVGVKDNFFELGGDSIKGIRIIAKLREAGYLLTLREIMERRKIENIIDGIKILDVDRTLQEAVIGEVNLSLIQNNFMESELPEPGHFNQSIVLESKKSINTIMLRKAFSKIVQHHDMLRATFNNGKQIIKSPDAENLYELIEFDLSAIQTKNEFNELFLDKTLEITSSIKLNSGPLVKIGHFATNESDYLFITIHHLVVDSVSWQIIIDDLNDIYSSLLSGKEKNISNKTDSYKKWVEEQTKLTTEFSIKKELPYWKKVDLNLSKSKFKLSSKEYKSVFLHQIDLCFSKEVTSNLVYKSIKPYGSEVKDLLLTALFRTIAKINNNNIAAVSLETHGRENALSSLMVERTVGWFTNIYPVVVSEIGRDLQQDIINVKETLKRVPNHGIGYQILKSNYKEILSQQATPDITFNYLGEQQKHKNDENFVVSELKYAHPISFKNVFGTPISIDGIIVDGELRFSVSFDLSRFTTEFIKCLINRFDNEVQNVVKHCSIKADIIKTPSDYGELDLSVGEFNDIKKKVENANGFIKRMYPLTPMQEGILFHTLQDESNESYVVQGIFKSDKSIDINTFKRALQLLSEKHEVLKTNIFSSQLSEPRQVILKNKEIEFSHIDISDTNDSKLLFKSIAKDDLIRGFNLERESLIRFAFVKQSEEEFKLIMTFHHIIMDGWCMSVLMNDLLDIYNRLTNSPEEFKQKNEHKDQGTFEDYVRIIRNKDTEKSINYWGSLLNDFSGANTIKPVLQSKTQETSIDRIMHSLPVSLFKSIKDYAQKNNSTLNTVIELAWGILLQSYNSSNDVVFGKVVSGRDSIVKNIDEVIGLFINTIPVRLLNQSTDLAIEVLNKLQKQALDSMENGYTSLADIQNLTELGSELIQTLIIFENYYVADNTNQSDTGLSPVLDSVREETNYDLTLSIDTSDTLTFDLLYNQNKYQKLEAEVLIGRLENILNQIVHNSNVQMKDIQVITEGERKTILKTFNNTALDFDKNKSIIQLIEENASLNPEKIAVVYNDIQLTYKELNEKSNIIANQLYQRGINRKGIVALILQNSPEMIISILGILKTGAAYVPLDPNYPNERIDLILKDCGANIILSNEEYVVNDFVSLRVESMLTNSNVADTTLVFERAYYPEDLQTILYTSGTTGKPKGVMLKNSNILAYVYAVKEEFSIDENTNFLQQATYTFDMFIEEVFPTLSFGGTVSIYPKLYGIDFEELCDYVNQKEVNIISCSPLALKEINKLNKTKSVRTYISGGEEIKPSYYDNLIQNAEVYNTYGPTEATVCCTYFKISGEELNNVSIGKPISNAQVYILSNDNQLCGINSPGEICVSGSGITDGYLNQDILTNEKFVPNPFGEGKLYRTGDVGKWMPDGTITYLGRIDNQIKLRGYRIELSEIEVNIRENLDVTDVAVTLKTKEEEKIICVYVQSDNITEEEVYKELKAKLPSYMVPTHISVVKSLPMNSNGKIDFKKLEIPEVVSLNKTSEPTNEIEKVVLAVFQDTLGGNFIGLDDDFFEVGGHSLKAVRLIAMIEKKTNIQLKVVEIFDKRTVREISKLIKDKETCNDLEVNWGSLEDEDVEELV
ncbi:amino acid adenylation domain-containing protein [Priestia aryabhattai]|uniref:amino acid adenylation domain-containing protein n=1 Tax=Priestia aryabhattai TaxID=412384 RepID=UPI0030EE0E5B